MATQYPAHDCVWEFSNRLDRIPIRADLDEIVFRALVLIGLLVVVGDEFMQRVQL